MAKGIRNRGTQVHRNRKGYRREGALTQAALQQFEDVRVFNNVCLNQLDSCFDRTLTSPVLSTDQSDVGQSVWGVDLGEESDNAREPSNFKGL